MSDVLVRFGGILVLAAVAVWLYSLLDAITAERDRVRLLPKGLWVATVLLLFVAGGLAWLEWGRPRATRRRPRVEPQLGTSVRTSWPSARPGMRATGPSRRRAPVAPDDDPEFLARLDRQAAKDRDDERLLGWWDADLRRREEEFRRDGNADGEQEGGGEPPAAS